jgi:hypothetical protein
MNSVEILECEVCGELIDADKYGGRVCRICGEWADWEE